MGQAAAHIADIIMEDVYVPGDALLGGEGARLCDGDAEPR
jgi:acyl-CoA dehydrogenase